MRLLYWFFGAIFLVLLFVFGAYAVDGFSRGSVAWIGGIFFILFWVLRTHSEKQAQQERRIKRLEDELGKHQRWHGHMTEFKE